MVPALYRDPGGGHFGAKEGAMPITSPHAGTRVDEIASPAPFALEDERVMAEQHLDDPDVGAELEQVRREASVADPQCSPPAPQDEEPRAAARARRRTA